MFYIKGEKLPVELNKGDFVIVSDGDEFSLVPDSYRFRVVIPSQVDANHNERVETVDNTAKVQTPDHTYERHLPSWMTGMAKRDESKSSVKASRPQKREDEISDQSVVNKKLKVASEDSDVPGSKTEPKRAKLHEMSDEEEGGSVRDQEVKKEIEESSAKHHEISDEEEGGSVRDQEMKTEIEESSAKPHAISDEEEGGTVRDQEVKTEIKESSAKPHEISDEEEGGSVRDQEVKTEIEDSSEDVANTAAQAGDPSTGVTNQGTGNVQKKRCMYGAKCYR